MQVPMWNVRLYEKAFNTRVVYDGYPTLFTIKLHHGGEFTKFPDVNYIDGTVTYVDMVDIEEFSVHEMDAIMKKEHQVIRVYTEHGALSISPVLHNKGAFSLSPEYNRKRSWTKDKSLSSCNKKLAMGDVSEANVDGDKDHAPNDFDEAANEFDLGLYQQILESNSEFDNGFNEEKEGDEGEEVVNEVSANVDMRNYEKDARVEDDVDMGGYQMDVGIEDDVDMGGYQMDAGVEDEVTHNVAEDERSDGGGG
uniref:PB1-like domain-containing protein n=1 Tax=Lactuca sativa TaxID=4236 RepID=A0A9R1VUU1_LACSA|nr:hypothetical protein LSAT_V11C400165310 [Lactuca sativa]